MTELQNNSIKENILSAIERGKVTMKPKWHFILRAVLLVVGVVLVSMSLLFVVSFAVFELRESGRLFSPGFGVAGIQYFLLTLPLVFVLLALGFVIILEILVRRYQFAYRQPLLFSVLGITTAVVLAGFVIDRTRVHEHFLRQAEQDRLPFGGALYRGVTARFPKNLVVGVVQEKTNVGFNILGHHQEKFIILVTDKTILPPEELFEQDIVTVFGQRDKNVITAVGVKKLQKDQVYIMPARPKMRGM